MSQPIDPENSGLNLKQTPIQQASTQVQQKNIQSTQKTEQQAHQTPIPADKTQEQQQTKEQQQEEHKEKQVKVQELKVDEDDVQDEQIQKFAQQNLEKATEHKNQGNKLFKQGKCKQAILQYQKGLKYTDNKQLRATLYSNMAICFIKEEDYNFAKKYCKKVLKCDENHRKGRINLARCYQQDNKIQEAYEQYTKVQKNLEGASPADVKFARDKIAYLKPKIDAINESRKKQVMDGLKNIGNSILGYFGMSLDNFKLEQGANGGYNISFKQ